MKNKTKQTQYFVCKTIETDTTHFVVVSPGLYCNTGQKVMEKYLTKEDARVIYGEDVFEKPVDPA